MKSALATTFAIATATVVITLATTSAFATTPNYNFGSLGATANGVNDDGFISSPISPLSAPGDVSGIYGNNVNTVIPYQAALNPIASASFTVEFWAYPFATDNDDVPLSNRTTTDPRAGWTFFQRAAGWNFRMYSGIGTSAGYELTGGTAPLNAWSHVVVTWNGLTPTLYVNGQNTAAPVTGTGYAVNTPGIPMAIGAHDTPTGQSPYQGHVDEVAFYPSALSPADILEHFTAASNPAPGFYDSVVNGDGALVHYTNVPEPSAAALLLAGITTLARRRRSQRAS